jgi:F-type H+-transporting ATPase subunit epsilon
MATAHKTFQLEIITPEGTVLREEISNLVTVSSTGEIGILANHANMTSKLEAAPLRYTRSNGNQDTVAVIGGVCEIKDNKVTVISEYALKGIDVDEALAQQEAAKAKAALDMMKAGDTNQKELLLAEHKLKIELVKLQAARLRKT